MAEITNYQLVESGDDSEVKEAVLAAIRNGWQPFGSIAVTVWFDADWCEEPCYWYCQPMVKYGEG